ncbi:MAG TPA: hypothetical protein VLA49_04170 [Anaerolineales bacterium]|nr:hypothetical protein [Anaerolineales bacterium]
MPFTDNFFANNILASIVIWFLVYSGDYYLTIFGARLYRNYAANHISYAGSYELTPVFQKDIISLNLLSRRFIFFLLLSCGLIFIIWLLAVAFLK